MKQILIICDGKSTRIWVDGKERSYDITGFQLKCRFDSLPELTIEESCSPPKGE